MGTVTNFFYPAGSPNALNAFSDTDNDSSQFTYGENVGWINFGPTHDGVTIAYKVKACKVSLVDLALFCSQWLLERDRPANLDCDSNPSPDNPVDLYDYNILANDWLNFCPNGWPS